MTDTKSSWLPVYARREAGMQASEIRELLKLLERPDVISFAGGIPDQGLLPVELAREAYDAVLSDPALAQRALQYSTSEGHLPLREWIVQHMAGLGVACQARNVMITNGSQQGLEFLGKLFVTPGDSVLVAAPTYLGALQAFAASEPNYDPCIADGSNATPEACVVRAKAKGGRAAMAYVVSDFANPSGETLSQAGRVDLLRLSRGLGVPLVEDAAYSALRYDGQPIAPIQAIDLASCGDIERSCVIYCGTFSKTISPGLRVGWMVAAEPIIQKLVLIKQAGDLNSPLINQMVMLRMAEAAFDEQVKRARAIYRERRDAMLSALETHLGGRAQWSRPEGGLFVWVQLNDAINAQELLAAALAEQQVAFVSGKGFYSDDGGKSNLRLSFSQSTPEKIHDGVRRIGLALDKLESRAGA